MSHHTATELRLRKLERELRLFRATLIAFVATLGAALLHGAGPSEQRQGKIVCEELIISSGKEGSPAITLKPVVDPQDLPVKSARSYEGTAGCLDRGGGLMMRQAAVVVKSLSAFGSVLSSSRFHTTRIARRPASSTHFLPAVHCRQMTSAPSRAA